MFLILKNINMILSKQQLMKRISENQKMKSNSLSNAIKTKQGITEKESKIAKELNNYFIGVGIAFARKIPIVTKYV